MVEDILHPHENLGAWNKGMELVTLCYQSVQPFPMEERFGLVAQIRRAVISVPTNIAEGSARATSADTRRFYVIARASLMELDTLIVASRNLGFISPPDTQRIRMQIIEVSKLLNALVKYQTSRDPGIRESTNEYNDITSDPLSLIPDP